MGSHAGWRKADPINPLSLPNRQLTAALSDDLQAASIQVPSLVARRNVDDFKNGAVNGNAEISCIFSNSQLADGLVLKQLNGSLFAGDWCRNTELLSVVAIAKPIASF